MPDYRPFRPYYRLIAACLLLAAFAPIVPFAGQIHAQDDTALPTWEPADCPFETAEIPRTIECGYMIVPEDRAAPDGPTIKLMVAILHSTAEAPLSDPVVYLDGGPGDGPTHYPETWMNSPILDNRDLILLDQRGTGHSEPSLNCPEMDDERMILLGEDVDLDTWLDRMDSAARACHDRLVADGVNLAGFTSAASAADVADLRAALGLDEINLYGISYGTRLALTVLRDHPEGIRSVVLDSSYPTVVNAFPSVPSSADRAFEEFFAACTAGESCPDDLETVLSDVVARLNAEPVALTVEDLLTGEDVDVLMTGEVLLSMMFNMMYSAELIPMIPTIIDFADSGLMSPVAQIAVLFYSQLSTNSEGMGFSLNCAEEFPFHAENELGTAVAEYPFFEQLASAFPTYRACEWWPAAPADPIENTSVVSDVPTLIMAGQFDPITPPAWGALAAETLSNSYTYVYPGQGHAVSVMHPCPRGMLLSFIDNPTAPPDDACMADMRVPFS